MSKDKLGREIPKRTEEWNNNISKALQRGRMFKCIGCGNEFYCQRYRYTNKNLIEKYGVPKYCSMECQRKYREYGQLKGTKQPKNSLAKQGNKNPMFGKKPNEKQLEGLKLGRVERTTKTERRFTKTKCDLRRNKKRKYNGGSHTYERWQQMLKEFNYTCPCCGKQEPEVKLTEDHIIPISKGGDDNIDNIQPLCFSCNSKKNTKITKYEKI